MFFRSHRSSRFCCVAMVSLLGSPAMADSSHLDFRDKSFGPVHHWTSANGLPQSKVQCVFQSTDGYLWVGTQDGMARFDGVRFHIMDPSFGINITSSGVNAFEEDKRDHSLWIGTTDGLLHWQDHRFH